MVTIDPILKKKMFKEAALNEKMLEERISGALDSLKSLTKGDNVKGFTLKLNIPYSSERNTTPSTTLELEFGTTPNLGKKLTTALKPHDYGSSVQYLRNQIIRILPNYGITLIEHS